MFSRLNQGWAPRADSRPLTRARCSISERATINSVEPQRRTDSYCAGLHRSSGRFLSEKAAYRYWIISCCSISDASWRAAMSCSLVVIGGGFGRSVLTSRASWRHASRAGPPATGKPPVPAELVPCCSSSVTLGPRIPNRGALAKTWWRRAARPSGARQGAGVLDRLEGRLLRVGVGLPAAGLGVCHRDRRLDVGETSREDPEVLVECAAVEDLDASLDVRRGEAPQIARVVGPP